MSDSLTGGIFVSERIRRFAHQCGKVFRFSILNLIHDAMKLRHVDKSYMEIDEYKLRFYAVQSIEKWTQPIRNDESTAALHQYPDMADNYKYAFVKYAQNYYGTDDYGNRLDLNLRIPPFNFFLFEYYTIASKDNRVLYEEFYENEAYWKYTKKTLRAVLHKVTKGRVTIQPVSNQMENVQLGQRSCVRIPDAEKNTNGLIIQQDEQSREENKERIDSHNDRSDRYERHRNRDDRREYDRYDRDRRERYERSKERREHINSHKHNNNDSSRAKIINIDNVHADSDPYRNVDAHKNSDDDESEISSVSTV